jgi:hypothetical protein
MSRCDVCGSADSVAVIQAGVGKGMYLCQRCNRTPLELAAENAQLREVLHRISSCRKGENDQLDRCITWARGLLWELKNKERDNEQD